jgi:hypothetical protein
MGHWNWNLIGFVVVMTLLIADLVLLWRTMKDARRGATRNEVAALRVERAVETHSRLVRSSLIELADRGSGPASRRPERVAEVSIEGWGEQGERDTDVSFETDLEGQPDAIKDRVESGGSESPAHEKTKGPEPSREGRAGA